MLSQWAIMLLFGIKMGIHSFQGSQGTVPSQFTDHDVRTLLMHATEDGTSLSIPCPGEAIQATGNQWCLPGKIQVCCWGLNLLDNNSNADSPNLDVAHGHWNGWNTCACHHAFSRRKVPTQGSWIWASGLETSLPVPSTRDSSVDAVTCGVASFQQPHCGDALLSYPIRSKLRLSTSFNCQLDCTLKQAECSS